MSGPMSVACPHCGAGLKLKNQSFVGKKVPCPKCKEPFKVEAPEDEFLDAEDDYGAMDEAEEEEEEARPKSKGKGGGKGKKKSKGGGGGAKIAMIVGGVLLGVGVLGGLVYGAMSLMGGAGNSWVKWLPEDTDVVYQMRVADTLNAPVFKPFTDDPNIQRLIESPPMPGGGVNPAADFLQGLNLKAKDIDTVTVGLVNAISANANAAAPAMGMGMPAGPQLNTKQFVAVVRLKSPLDTTKFSQAPADVMVKEDYNGKAVYSLAKTNDPHVMVYPVDGTTVLIGSDVELKAAIDGNGKAPAHSRYSFANTSSSIVYVMAPKDTTKMAALGVNKIQMKNGVRTETSDSSGLYGLAFTVNLTSDVGVQIDMSMTRSLTAGTVADTQKSLDQAITSFPQIKQMASGGIPMVPKDRIDSMLTHVETMLKGATVSSSGSTVQIKMTLSGQVVADLKQAVSPFMPLLVAQIEQQAKASGSRAKPANTMGNSAMDVLNYPQAVISGGENAKSRVQNSAAQHNSAIESAMNESQGAGQGAAAPAATAANPAAMMKMQPANAGQGQAAGHAAAGAAADPSAMMKQMQQQGKNAGQANAGAADPSAMMKQMQQQGKNAGQANAGAADPNAMMKQMQQQGKNAGQANAGAADPNAMMKQMQQQGGQAPAEGAEGAAGGDAAKKPPVKSRRRTSK